MEKRLWLGTLVLFSTLFIRAPLCDHNPITASSIEHIQSFHAYPALVHSIG